MARNRDGQNEWSRRKVLGALAASAASLVGCGGSNAASGASGGAAGGGGSSSGGVAGSGGSSSGGAGGAGSGGQAGQGGLAGAASGGSAGSGGQTGLECKLTGPTPGCLVTEDNILGPYYKAGAPFRKDIRDGAVGDQLIIEGRVFGCDCVTPLAAAEVDIWQADGKGAYDGAGWVLRGRALADATGRYEFTAVLPGFYLNGASYRPRHVHYKVSHEEGTPLTTQLYFEGDPYIPTDPFVRESLVRPLSVEVAPDGTKLYRVTFDIVLA